MAQERLTFLAQPRLQHGTLVVSFSGWMDGGDVSTGTVRWLIGHLGAKEVARIDPRGFYLQNVPGSMEVAAVFRPSVRIRAGLIEAMELPVDSVYAAADRNLALFVGKEPNLGWEPFADLMLEMVERIGVELIVFIGTFAGNTPHTRQPRLYASVSDPLLKPLLEKHQVRFSDYEGPASFATYLMTRVEERGVKMACLVAEIPAYIQGTNPLSIEAVTRRLAAILGLAVDLSELRTASDEWENRVTAAAAKDPKLTKKIRKLEEQYDDELISPSGEA